MNDYQPWNRGEPPQDEAQASPRDRLPFHPLASHFPMMDRTSPEFKGLVASIQATGLWEAITMHEGMVLDGRNRLLACEEVGVEPRFEVFDEARDGPPLEFVLAKNLYRRHLTEGQRAMKAEEMVTTKHGGDRKSLFDGQEIKTPNGVLIGEPVVTIDKAATIWCVSTRAVDRAAFVREHTKDTPKIVAEVKAGRMTLGRAAMLAKEDAETQRAAPDVKYGGRKPKPRSAARPATVTAIRALTDDQFFAIVVRDLPRLNRAAAREGKRIVVTDLPH